MNKPKEYEYFRCSCYSPRHNLVVQMWEEGDNSEFSDISLSVRLCQYRNFFQRLWQGIKYILNYEIADYCEITLREKEVNRLIDVLEERKEFLWKE